MRLVRNIDDERWNNFALNHGWFWHTTMWQEFLCARSESGAFESLAVMDGDDLVAIIPLSKGSPVWAPAVNEFLDARTREAAWLTALRAVECAAQLNPLVPGFSEAALDFTATSIRLGRIDQSLTTIVIDLAASEDALLAEMSGRHRRTLEQAMDVEGGRTVVSGLSDDFERFRRLYRDEAGKEGVPDGALDVMGDWLSEYAMVALAETGGQTVAAHVILTYGNGAYYALSASSEEGRRIGAGHVLVWDAISWLKAAGYLRYELGVQHRGILPHDRSTAKEQAISLFKRGFGGREVPFLIRG